MLYHKKINTDNLFFIKKIKKFPFPPHQCPIYKTLLNFHRESQWAECNPERTSLEKCIIAARCCSLITPQLPKKNVQRIRELHWLRVLQRECRLHTVQLDHAGWTYIRYPEISFYITAFIPLTNTTPAIVQRCVQICRQLQYFFSRVEQK